MHILFYNRLLIANEENGQVKDDFSLLEITLLRHVNATSESPAASENSFKSRRKSSIQKSAVKQSALQSMPELSSLTHAVTSFSRDDVGRCRDVASSEVISGNASEFGRRVKA